MARAEELKAMSSTLSALCAYRNLYSLSNKELDDFNNAIEKVYVNLIRVINNG